MRSQWVYTATILLLSILAFTLAAEAQPQAENHSVLEDWTQWSDAPNQLQHYLNSAAFELLRKREAEMAQLKSAQDWKARQAKVKKILVDLVGPFPDKTALNARILGRSQQHGYVIEKIVFESRPNFFVTGCLFIPEGLKGKAPAILNVIGHTDIAFRAPSYQQLLLNLAKKSFIVFAIDPIGQGERLQYYDPALKRSLVGGPTTEHSYLGTQCFLTGSSAAHYFVWDGIRAIDYLVSRAEVDPLRIGVTGISGGGTQTSYIAALDERVAAAAPACYITSFRRLLESIGPQDAEQNFNGGVLNGIDHADLLEVRAPRPTLVVSTTRDFFSIQGARESFAESKAAFRALGGENSLAMAEDDHGHGYTKRNREAIYRFFQQHLNNPGNPADEEVQALRPEEMSITASGQVSDSLGGETVFSLNQDTARRLARRLQESRQVLSSHLAQIRKKVPEVSGYIPPSESSETIFRGGYQRRGCRVEMYGLVERGVDILPVLLFLPEDEGPHPALIYLHPGGKAAAAQPDGEIERICRKGFAVLAPDLSGTGELGRVSEATAFLGVQTGRSICGIRTAEILRCLHFLKSRKGTKLDFASGLARGEMCIPLLHAAVLEESIRQIVLMEPLLSLESVAMNRFYELDPGSVIPNVLAAYDLPDLEAALAPRRLALVDVVDHLHKPASVESLRTGLEVVRRSYVEAGSEGNLIVTHSIPGQGMEGILGRFLR